jgi:cytochrome c oxidase assembly factor CtaG
MQMRDKRKEEQQRQQDKHRHSPIILRRYLPVGIFIALTIISMQTPILELAEEKLSTHMIFEHLAFFIIGALSVISAERILQLLYLRQRQKLLAINQNGNNFQDPSFSLSSKLLSWWGSLLRSVFSIDQTGILWISIAIILMALWHYPPVFDTAALNPKVHILQHFSFVIVGAVGYISIRVWGESYRILLLIALIGMMGFAGLLFSVMDSPVYLAYPVWQHNEAGFYMVITSTLLLIIGLPMYLIKKTMTYVKATRLDKY